jgi:hypothetical protein
VAASRGDLGQDPLLRGAPAGVVAQEVDGDRVQPRLLRAAPAVEEPPAPQRPLEGVGHEVLGHGAVARPHDEEREQRLGVLGEEAIEGGVVHKFHVVGPGTAAFRS